MAERADGREAGDGNRDAYQPPAGCGFTGCMWFVIIGFSLLMALLVFGLLAREWVTPVVPPR